MKDILEKIEKGIPTAERPIPKRTMTFKGTKKKTKEIAGEVNVRYVLEGSVRKAGNNLRITAQLIDALTDTHMWAEKFGGTLDDIFDIQEKVSRSIVEALKLRPYNLDETIQRVRYREGYDKEVFRAATTMMRRRVAAVKR